MAKLIGIIPERPRAQPGNFDSNLSISDEDHLLSELGLRDFELNF